MSEPKILRLVISAMADSAVAETEHLKREIAHLEAQIPSDNASRVMEKQIREQTGERYYFYVNCWIKSFLSRNGLEGKILCVGRGEYESQ